VRSAIHPSPNSPTNSFEEAIVSTLARSPGARSMPFESLYADLSGLLLQDDHEVKVAWRLGRNRDDGPFVPRRQRKRASRNHAMRASRCSAAWILSVAARRVAAALSKGKSLRSPIESVGMVLKPSLKAEELQDCFKVSQPRAAEPQDSDFLKMLPKICLISSTCSPAAPGWTVLRRL